MMHEFANEFPREGEMDFDAFLSALDTTEPEDERDEDFEKGLHEFVTRNLADLQNASVKEVVDIVGSYGWRQEMIAMREGWGE